MPRKCLGIKKFVMRSTSTLAQNIVMGFWIGSVDCEFTELHP